MEEPEINDEVGVELKLKSTMMNWLAFFCPSKLKLKPEEFGTFFALFVHV